MVRAERKDYTKICWSCGKKTTQPEGSFYRCSSCGATYNDVSIPGMGCLFVAPRIGDSGTRGRPWGAPD